MLLRRRRRESEIWPDSCRWDRWIHLYQFEFAYPGYTRASRVVNIVFTHSEYYVLILILKSYLINQTLLRILAAL